MKYLVICYFLAMYQQVSAQIPTVSSGTIRHFEKMQSNYVQPRNIDVWLPSNYDSTKKYAVRS